MLGLLIRPAVLPDEGLQGYLGRLALANALDGREVRRQYRQTPPMASDVALLSPSWSGAHLQLTAPLPVPMPLWNTRTRRYCPCCLAEAPHWRALWELTLATACPRHQAVLRQACPACGEELSWHCSDLRGCGRCGASLLFAAPVVEPATIEAIWMSSELERRLGTDVGFPGHHLTALPLAEFHQLTACLGARRAAPARAKPLKVPASEKLHTANSIVLAAAELLQGWPQGFRAHIRPMLEGAGGASWRLPQRMGLLYRDVFRRLTSPHFGFVRDVMEAAIAQYWNGPLTARNRYLPRDLVQRHAWVPIGVAAGHLQLEAALIRRMVAAGEVLSERHQSSSGKASILVYLEDLARRQEDLLATLSLETFASRLCLPEERVRQLLQGGLFPFVGGAPGAGERWWIANAGVEALARLGTILPVYATPPASLESMARILRYRLRTPAQAVEVLRRIGKGELRPLGRLGAPEAIGQWLFSLEAVVPLQVGASPSAGMTLRQCAERLGVKEQVTYELARLGLIPVHGAAESGGKGRGRRVAEQDLVAFQDRFVLGVELAKAVNVPPRTLARMLISNGVIPVAGPVLEDRPCRQYLWERTPTLMAQLPKIVNAAFQA